MKKVLIVDDSRLFRNSLARAVQGHLEVVGMAQDGREAFELYKNLKPDLVFLDVTMPNCDGKECLQEIINFHKDAKIIMISGLESTATVEECLKSGARGFINKTQIGFGDEQAQSRFIEQIHQFIGSRE